MAGASSPGATGVRALATRSPWKARPPRRTPRPLRTTVLERTHIEQPPTTKANGEEGGVVGQMVLRVSNDIYYSLPATVRIPDCPPGTGGRRHLLFPIRDVSRACSAGPLAATLSAPGETEAGSAGTQPDQGITRPTVARWAPHQRSSVTSVAGDRFPPSDTRAMPPKIQPAPSLVADSCPTASLAPVGSPIRPRRPDDLAWPSWPAPRGSSAGSIR